jgi:hypothetical protein
METIVIRAKKSDTKFVLDFAKRIGVLAKIFDTEAIEDAHLISLIEEGLKTENVSRSEVFNVLEK